MTSSLRVQRGTLLGVLPLAAYRALNGGVPVLIGLYLGSRWGLSILGAYTVANAFVAVVVAISDWGCTRFLPREISRHPGQTTFVSSATGIRLLLAASLIAAGSFYGASGGFARDVLAFLLLLSPVSVTSIVSTNGISARVVDGSVRRIGVAVASGLLPLAGAVVAAQRGLGSPQLIVIGYVTGKIVESLLLVAGRGHLLRVSFRHWKPVFRNLLPFSTQAIFGVVYSRLPLFVVERWSTRAELGVLSAATAIQNVFLIVPTSLILIGYPRMTAAAHQGDREGLFSILKRYAIPSLVTYVGGLPLLWFALGRVSRLLHLPVDAAPFVLSYVSAGLLSMGNAMSGAVLQAVGSERVAARISAVVLPSAVPLQILAVSTLGMRGALIALLLTESGALIAHGVAVRRALRDLHAVGAAEEEPPPAVTVAQLE